jgi:hypothetical protein
MASGAVLSGTLTIGWSGSDQDGPGVEYQLQFSQDGARWTPLMPLGMATSLPLDTRLLPSGNGQLRIMATDGFNTVWSVRSVSIANPLRIAGQLPAPNAVDVDINTTVNAVFGSDVATATLPGSFQLREGGVTPVPGAIDYFTDSRTAIFMPDQPLKSSTAYTAVVGASVADVNGFTVGTPVSWSFTTAPDSTPPLVVDVSPLDASLNVPINALVQARFGEPMAPATIDATTFQLLDAGGSPVSGTILYQQNTRQALFVPSGPLTPSARYTALVSVGATDTAGNALEAPREWSFTTGTTATATNVRIIGNYADEPNDPDGDGLFDTLTIYVDVEVLTAGTFNLNGRLVDKTGTLLAWQTAGDRVLSPGVYTLPLVFPGVPIRSNGVDGPYVLDALYFYNTSAPNVGDVRFNAFQTFAYDVTKFYSVLTLSGLPDQLLEAGTTRDNAFNLRDHTTHRTLPLTSVTYTVLVNSNPAVGVSIDADANIDINPAPGVEAESDVTVEARDPLGNRVLATFRISIQGARAAVLVPTFKATMPANTAQTIGIEIRDQFDRPFTTPVDVGFSTTRGKVEPATVTAAGGTASTLFTAGSGPGTAFVTVTAGTASVVISIQITGGGGTIADLRAATRAADIPGAAWASMLTARLDAAQRGMAAAEAMLGTGAPAKAKPLFNVAKRWLLDYNRYVLHLRDKLKTVPAAVADPLLAASSALVTQIDGLIDQLPQ